MAKNIINIDILENEIVNLSPQILRELLSDKSSGKNIVWATNNYEAYGEFYKSESEIVPELITGENGFIIQPRVSKCEEHKITRTKEKGEVFTPAWVCNVQNNLIDCSWFGYKPMFNQEYGKSWITNYNKIIFPSKGRKKWKNYVESCRLEITCGEAPYLVSRYDSVTGKYIPVINRIGLLDRKLRVVNENTFEFCEWYKWTKRAFQSIYGYEYQGDSLLLARENLLFTFIDNIKYKWNKNADVDMLLEIANIISWNIWQMNGLDYTIPYSNIDIASFYSSKSLFSNDLKPKIFCRVKDWKAARCKAKSVFEFREII